MVADPKSTDNTETQNWILSDKTKNNPCGEGITHCNVTNSILGLYYYAKNVVYTDPNYYDEMKKIQARSDFARSIALIAFVYFLITILFIVVLFFDSLIGKKETSTEEPDINEGVDEKAATDVQTVHETKKIKKKKDNRDAARPVSMKETWEAAAIILITLVVIMGFAGWAYVNESNEFNKRAFGYFNSMLTREKVFKQKVDDKKTRVEINGSLKLDNLQKDNDKK